MPVVRRYGFRLGLLALLILLGLLVAYRIKDQQAQAVTRARSDVVVGTVTPARRDMEINAGQLPVEIDDLELRATVDQARAALETGGAGLEVARSTLEGNRATLENQRANLANARAVADNDPRQAERMKTLFERGLVAATDFEDARTSAESSRAGLHAAEAQLRLAEVPRHGALTIPGEAVRPGEARPTVMVVRKGAVAAVPVELGPADAQGVQVVLKGLSDGDQVILQGKDLVRPEQKVRAVPATGQ
jgi:multidrug efflux pump subunit AcrA (membrane-fusion protein)